MRVRRVRSPPLTHTADRRVDLADREGHVERVNSGRDDAAPLKGGRHHLLHAVDCRLQGVDDGRERTKDERHAEQSVRAGEELTEGRGRAEVTIADGRRGDHKEIGRVERRPALESAVDDHTEREVAQRDGGASPVMEVRRTRRHKGRLREAALDLLPRDASVAVGVQLGHQQLGYLLRITLLHHERL